MIMRRYTIKKLQQKRKSDKEKGEIQINERADKKVD